jgi:hypothetical protein
MALFAQKLFHGRNDDRGYTALLDALTRELVDAETTELERVASARQSPVELQEAQERIERSERSEARRELDDFRDGLQAARAAAGPDGQGEVALDARDPRQDQLAGALIQYVVRPGYAEVRTEEPEEGQYVYYIRVDWERLRHLARDEGHPLDL